MVKWLWNRKVLENLRFFYFVNIMSQVLFLNSPEMSFDTLWWNEELNEKKISQEVKWESFDLEKYSEDLTSLQEEANENKKQQLKEADNLEQKLLTQYMVEEEKIRLDQFNEAIMDIDLSNNKENFWYKNIREILNKDITTNEKLELMVKIIHNMDGEIDITYRDNKQEHENFYCWNRALFFNYLFNNYNDKLNIEKSTICLPYGHAMNVIKLWWEAYIVDWWAWCFNKIEYTIEEKWSWKCIKLNKSIDAYEGVRQAYPYTNFPYTENLNKEQLEIYTSFNLQAYSYFFTDRLYSVARDTYKLDISDKNCLKDLLEKLKREENPLQLILDEGDSLAKWTQEQQIKTLQSHIDSALPYEENLKKFNSINTYMSTIAKDYPDLSPEFRGKTLKEFHADDIKTMDALNIPKEKIPKILTKLKEKTDEENMVNYILNKFNNNEPILDDTELDTIVRNFLEAVNIKATQSNSSLKDYLPEYLSNLKIS